MSLPIIGLLAWLLTTIALLAIGRAAARVREAREEGFIFGFTAGVEAALETVKGARQVVDPVHRAAQLDRAQRGLQ